MGRVIRVRSISPCEDMSESPGRNLPLSVCARLHGGTARNDTGILIKERWAMVDEKKRCSQVKVDVMLTVRPCPRA